MEVATLYGSRLSPREQQILAQIQSTLNKDVSTWNGSYTPAHVRVGGTGGGNMHGAAGFGSDTGGR
ncbi:hypothetical protein SAMN02787118_13440 [Streptomyces mirabilis]|uniref:Uncharacterized protein n=1 Tax=Streptomyces mirabilis TaxID=68239 RepID=A0A1I2W1D3_9ACTN|nr:hypothetical protein SAMN02787118_13440 [Streptomyces mirabilis]